MALPAHARVQAAQSFVRDLRSAQEFLHRQDSHRAEERYVVLLGEVKAARDLLGSNPSTGRPARFLEARSAQGRAMADRATALAAANGLPELRELILKPYVLLYANGKDRVVLLALKHERQLMYELV
jgi:hypothetical protein